jgi:hypothetical protein
LTTSSLPKSPKCREVNYLTTKPPLPKKPDGLFIAGLGVAKSLV